MATLIITNSTHAPTYAPHAPTYAWSSLRVTSVIQIFKHFDVKMISGGPEEELAFLISRLLFGQHVTM